MLKTFYGTQVYDKATQTVLVQGTFTWLGQTMSIVPPTTQEESFKECISKADTKAIIKELLTESNELPKDMLELLRAELIRRQNE